MRDHHDCDDTIIKSLPLVQRVENIRICLTAITENIDVTKSELADVCSISIDL